MAGNIKDLIVRIMVDDGEVEKFQKAGSKAMDFGTALDKGAVVSAGALALLAGGAMAAGSAAAEAEQSQIQLQFALDQFPATADTTSAKLYELNSALALKTQYDDDAYASGQALLASFGLTGAQIEQMTPLLGDYAAKTGVDVVQAAEELGKALMGQGRALKDVGIDFEDAGSVGANYDQIMAGLTTQVGGFAEVQGNTATGASAIFQNSMGELLETLGQGLLPIMVNVTKSGVGLMGWMKDNTGFVQALAIGVGGLAGAILLTNGALKGYALVQATVTTVKAIATAGWVADGLAVAASTGQWIAHTTALGASKIVMLAGAAAQGIQTAAQWANNAAWLASPVTWIILAIIVGIGLLVAAGIWLYENWDAVTQWLGEAWQNTADWFIAVGDGIASWWNGLWSGIAGWVLDTFGPMILWVHEKFLIFQLGLKIIGDGIASWWTGLWSGIGDFFASIWGGLQGIVRGAWNGIVGWIEGGVNSAIGLINGIIRGINNVGGMVGIHLNLIPSVHIPRLATGGITAGPQLAMVGDNPGGREAIIPLDSPAGRDLLGGGGPTELGDETIGKLVRGLASVVRNQSRTGGFVTS